MRAFRGTEKSSPDGGGGRCKIVQIMYTGFGGLGSLGFSLVGADAERRYDWIIGFIGDQPLDPSYQRRCIDDGIGWQAFQSTAGRPYRAWLRLARWLHRERPDAVLLHSINSILPCRWYCWRRGAPLVAVEHTPTVVKTRTEWAASRLSMVLADRVVLLTEEYREELRRAHGPLFRAGKTAIIPNGIDTAFFRPAVARPWKRRAVKLGLATRFSFAKRQDLLVEMMGVLRQRRPEVNWQLSLAGDGERLESVRRTISESGLADVVRLEGLLDQSQVADWLRGLDIYVHASEGETVSMSLLQAMATGLPIVASNVPGIVDVMRADGEIGLLAPNDAESFADAVIALAEDDELRSTLAARARRACLQSYSHRAMFERYLEVIRCAGRAAAPAGRRRRDNRADAAEAAPRAAAADADAAAPRPR